jgi:hypothetical protein
MSALALFGLSVIAGCGATTDESTASENGAALAACHLNDGTVDVSTTDLRACDPQNTKKTTICHIPPGNPANAHTLCVGNAAVPAHLHNHGDSLGPCVIETACPPPPTGAGGAVGSGGQSGSGSGGAGEITIVP